jgi:hypothetical protein
MLSPVFDGFTIMNAATKWSEFTEVGFRSLLLQLKDDGYRFARYGHDEPHRHVLWRHDVDLSLHRATRLAEIEAEEGAVATYFVNPRWMLYNLEEPEILACVRRIIALGHQIDVEAMRRKSGRGPALKRPLRRSAGW